MTRAFILLFSLASYGLFLLVFCYLLAFLVNLPDTAIGERVAALDQWVPYTIDAGRPAPPLLPALLVNLGLIALFGLQHSVMARQGFKRLWTRLVGCAAERSVYVLASSVILAVVMWGWQPMPAPRIWAADSAAGVAFGYGVLGLGVVILLWSTFLIDHFDLFGLRQAVAAWQGRTPGSPRFMTPMLYRLVRHPLYLGWFLIFWGTPVMSAGHLLFAAGMTGYIFVAIRYEERDLVALHGADYQRYREQVPMVVPVPGRRYRAGWQSDTASEG